jgi:hypothetical protein
VLEHGEVARGALGEREGRVRHEPGRVVDERDEVGAARAMAVADLRPVHDVAHPEVARGRARGARPALRGRMPTPTRSTCRPSGPLPGLAAGGHGQREARTQRHRSLQIAAEA